MKLRQASLAVILVTVFIDIVGMGMVYPILPRLVAEMLHGEVANASAFYGILVAIYCLMNFLASPTLGALSDAIGRRPVIFISLAGLGIDYLILALAPNLWWLVAARALAGMLSATYTAAAGYIADISPPEKRAQNFGMIGVAFGIGFIVGPLVGGLLGEIGPRVPFVVAAGFSLVNCLFGVFVVPESLRPENRRRFTFRDANPLGAFMKVAAYPALVPLLAVAILTNFAERGMESVGVLYTAYRFGWGPFQVGVSLAFVGFLVAIVQGGLIRIVVPRFGEWRTLVLSLVAATFAFVLYAFVTEAWMAYAVMVLHIVGWGCAGPAIQALASKAVPANEQGLVQGVFMAIATSVGVVSAPVSAGLFAWFIRPDAPFLFPGASFMLGASLFFVALLFVRRAPEYVRLAARPAVEAA